MKLSTRLLLLTLGCLLPVIGAQIYNEIALRHERQHQLNTVALRQAQLARVDLDSIVNGAVQLATSVAQFPEVTAGGTACETRLASLQRTMPPYRFLAVVRDDGTLACGSSTDHSRLPDGAVDWLINLPPGIKATVGHVSGVTARDSGFLPIFVRVSGEAGERTIVAALNLAWLNQHLQTAWLGQASLFSAGSLFIIDGSATIAGLLPEQPGLVGRPLPESLASLVRGADAGTTTITDEQGGPLLAAYVPSAKTSAGFGVVVSIPLPVTAADIDRASAWDLSIIIAASLVTLALAWYAGRRFIYRPTQELLASVRRWREGNLAARADLNESGSEFAALANAFNAMAASLQARELERRLQAQYLESQVAERTRELSESNNRLQVEIAEREKTEAALHQAQKLQAVGQLAGGIAHDFNNMLATVLGNLELMERRVQQASRQWTKADAERLGRLIERASGAVQRGAQLTSRLLAFSRRQRLSVRASDLNRLVAELITLATSTLGPRIRVVSHLAPDIWPALVDPSQVEAAILNLCLNARDAMPTGGELTITTSNEIIHDRHGDDDMAPGHYVRVSITDTGIGMTPDIRRRAFDPFFTTKGPGGSGLGLSQVYGMARQSGGTVWIESEPGKGTEVSLLLPRAMNESEVAPSPTRVETDAERRVCALPGDLVLVVDDDYAVRQVTVEMLRDLGFEVAQAPGGAEALTLLDGMAQVPCIALLDYAMPGMNGLQLARALRERGLAGPIALVTGYAELAEVDTQTGPLDALLRKPFTIRELQGLVTRLRQNAVELQRVPEPATHA